MRFKSYLTEEEEAKNPDSFDPLKLVPLAMKWLKMKFPEDDFGFEFKYMANVTNATKTYSVAVDGKEFDIEGRIFDKNGSGKEDAGDVVQFRINPTEEAPAEEEKEPAFGA